MFRKSAVQRREDDRRSVSLAVVREYQSEVAARREQPYPRGAGLTIHVICGLFAFAFVFMYFSHIDRVVSAPGSLATAEPPLVYQALDPSVIRSLDVREGQRVGKGQVLATLDPTFAAASVNQLRAQIEGLRSQIARDQALIDLQPLVYPEPASDQIARYQRENLEYYRQQMAQYRASMNSFDQKIATLQSTIDKFKVDEARYANETETTSQIERMRGDLEKHGTGSMLNLLMATQSKIEAQRLGDFSHNSRVEAEHTLASTQADQKAYAEQFKGQVSADLLTARSSLEGALPQLDAALKHQDLVRWTAPEDSVILSIGPNLSVGSVVAQGTTVVTLMPVRNPLEALVQVPSAQVGFLRPGDPVTIKVDAFRSNEFGELEGTLKWVGDNANTQLNNQAVPAYFNARVTIDRNKLINVPATVSLLPGMTLSSDIKVGSRSVWNFVMGALTRGVGEAMREP